MPLRFISYKIVILLLAAFMTYAADASISKPERSDDLNGWSTNQVLPPLMHTNQDGPMGSSVLPDDWGILTDRHDALHTIDLIDLIHQSSHTLTIDSPMWSDQNSDLFIAEFPVNSNVVQNLLIPQGMPIPAPGVLSIFCLISYWTPRGRRRTDL